MRKNVRLSVAIATVAVLGAAAVGSPRIAGLGATVGAGLRSAATAQYTVGAALLGVSMGVTPFEYMIG